ncbi:unnamed protein product [Schistosoma mattheei]|uniref:Uncharacterized protein n=1 Tax=Schistosoma mattheei TaxID=31246 RepID=A0A183Q1P3_9TREM|nr:unnamed protein product [Schistosoma mattheei]
MVTTISTVAQQDITRFQVSVHKTFPIHSVHSRANLY